MHNQHTLHLTNAEFNQVTQVLASDNGSVPDHILINQMVASGIRQYPAEKLVSQHKQKMESSKAA